MFGRFRWPRRRLSPKEERAYALGQQFGTDLANALATITEKRLKPVRERCLEILRTGIHKSIESEDVSPFTAARVEYAAFTEQLDKLRQVLNRDIADQLHPTLGDVKGTDIEREVAAVIENHVATLFRGVEEAGMRQLAQYVHALDAADAVWRAANPTKAAEFRH